MKLIRVLLADDHALVRSGIRALLEKLPGIEVVGEAADGRAALAILKSRPVDVALMDISMPGMSGLEALEHVARESPGTRVIILSVHGSAEHIHRALRAGAAGYVLKDAGPEELGPAVRAVARGESYLSPAVSKQVVADYVRGSDRTDDPLGSLTPRQREVLQLIAEGATTKDVARKLGLSVKTVESHRAELMARLDLHDVAGLVRFAIRVGLVDADR